MVTDKMPDKGTNWGTEFVDGMKQTASGRFASTSQVLSFAIPIAYAQRYCGQAALFCKMAEFEICMG